MRDRRRYIILVLTVIGLLVGSGLACFADNLLINPGFESGVPTVDGRIGDTGVGSGWHCEFLGEFSGVADEVASNTTTARTDSKKLCFFGYDDVTSSNPAIVSVYEDSMVIPNTDYTVSVYVRGVDFTGNGFGKSGDVARLLVRELDTNGYPTVELANVQVTTTSTDYQLLTATIRPATNKIRFELYSSIGCTYQDGCVLFDDCSLDGAYPPYPLNGTVTSGGSPVEGATVTYGDLSAVTDSNGKYEILGVRLAQYLAVRASKTGYLPQKKWREMSPDANIVDFELPAAGNNLLANPGFEDGNTPHGQSSWAWPDSNIAGWTTDLWAVNLWNESANNPGEYKSGEEAEDVIVWHYTGVPNDGSLSQTINVKTSSHYTAKVWLKGIGPSWGVNLAQKGELAIKLIDFDGNATELTSALSNFTDWQQQIIEFDTPANVDTVKFIVRAHMLDAPTVAPLARLIMDDAELDGPTGLGPMVFGKITSGGSPVAGATVTYGDTLSATTDNNGDYTISGVPQGQNLAVRASKTGYYPQKRWRTANGSLRCNIDMPAVGSNLLINPGFEDGNIINGTNGWGAGAVAGWTTDLPSVNNIWNESANSPVYVHAGEEAEDVIVWHWSGVPNDGSISQTINVRPSSHYSAKVWLKGIGPSWRAGSAQKGELAIKLIDFDGAVTELTSALSNFTDWQQQVINFDTPANVDTVKFVVRAHMVESPSTIPYARLIIDDAELNGFAGLGPALFGKITSGNSPIAGATVTYGSSLSATTDANGDYSIAGVPLGQNLVVRASKNGYYPQKRWRTVNGSVRCNIDMPAVGNNLLINPGFEDTATAHGVSSYGSLPGGWTDEVGLPNYWNESANSPAYDHSGEEAQDIIGWYYGAPPCDGALSQTANVCPGAHYGAKVWLKSIGPSWGTNPAQKGELVVKMIHSDSSVTELTSTLTNFTDWQQQVINFDAPADVTTVKFIVRAHILDTYFARLIIDDAELNGPAAGLSTLKQLADNSDVYLKDVVVTAVFSGCYYVEEKGRQSAIKVIGSATVGDVLAIRGTMTTSGGERAITPTSVWVLESTYTIKPLGLVNKSLGGGTNGLDAGVTDGTGINTIGLLVKTTGSVTDAAGSNLIINDGSGTPVSVTGVTETFTTTNYVSVIGISSITVELDGTRTRTIRAIKVTRLN
ncbi:MAG: carboxypeptidase regulatory-like domain-containing protein [Armatimonadota bacterium]|nr:carboxypeptidase regulatory-like domain-containing protein [bacterium]